MQKRSGATCHMAMPQGYYLAKGANRPSHTTNTIKFDRIPFDPCNSIKRFDLCPFGNRTFRQKKIRDVSANFFCRNVRRHVFAETSFAETSCSPLGYVPISFSAPRPLGAAYIPILLSEVEQEQRPSGNGDREAIVVGAGLCDGEGERAYIAYIMRDVSATFLS